MAAAGTRDDNRYDDLDDALTDNDLSSEIELVSELVLAATSSDGPLDQDEVDLLLGLAPKEALPKAEAEGQVY